MAKTKRDELSDDEWERASPKTGVIDYGKLHVVTHNRGLRPRDALKILQELTEHELDALRKHEYTVFNNGPAKDLQD